MIRTRAINYLIENRGYESYLEIGLSWPEFNYAKIRCKEKESCDPYFPTERDAMVTRDNLPEKISKYLTYLMTSDEMFDAMPEDKKYDIIFIDGLHTEEQCCKDIVNSMKHLNPGGVILVHDVIPLNEKMQREDAEGICWVGTVWKSIVKLNNTNISFHTIKEDYGLAVIDYCPIPIFGDYLEPSGYDFNEDFSLEALHFISDKAFRDMYHPLKTFKAGEPTNLVVYVDVDKNAAELTTVQRVHFQCIEAYKDEFSNITFILGVDKGCPYVTVKMIREAIMSIGFSYDVTIKTKKKSIFGSSSAFYEEIVDKLSELDGATAFIECVDNDDREEDSYLKEIMSAYFQMFDNMEFVKQALFGKPMGICYGAFLFYKSAPTKKKWGYCDGFQWINTKRLCSYIAENKISVPKVEDKAYAKNFLGNILPFDFTLIDSWGDMYITSDISIMKDNPNAATVCILESNDSVTLYDVFFEDITNILCISLSD